MRTWAETVRISMDKKEEMPTVKVLERMRILRMGRLPEPVIKSSKTN